MRAQRGRLLWLQNWLPHLVLQSLRGAMEGRPGIQYQWENTYIMEPEHNEKFMPSKARMGAEFVKFRENTVGRVYYSQRLNA